MFISTFKKFRKKIISNNTIISLLHLGSGAFSSESVGTIVQSAAFVMNNNNIKNQKGSYLRLINSKHKKDHMLQIISNKNSKEYFTKTMREFKYLPNRQILYNISEKIEHILKNATKLKEFAEANTGMQTGKNPYFTRNWYEVNNKKINSNHITEKWNFYMMGGISRKWYGSLNPIINWKNNGKE